MDDKIESLELELRMYMNKFCDLVTQSTKVDSERDDVTNLANDLKDSHRKMVGIVELMKQLDDTEE